jgi:hypothetical protein
MAETTLTQMHARAISKPRRENLCNWDELSLFLPKAIRGAILPEWPLVCPKNKKEID